MFQSNILYLMYFSGSFIVFAADVIVQVRRKGGWCPELGLTEHSTFCNINPITKLFIGVFLFNTVLWIFMNYQWYKKRMNHHRHCLPFSPILEVLLDEITDPIYVLALATFSWLLKKVRYYSIKYNL